MKQFARAAIIAALLLPGATSLSQAQIKEVNLRVDGLACPFCAYGLEKKLKRIEGVGDVTVNIDDGVAHMTNKNEESIHVESLRDAVTDAGFTVRKISASIEGEIEEHNGTLVLVDDTTEIMLILKENEQLTKLKSIAAGAEVRVQVTGVLGDVVSEKHHNHPYTLEIKRFEVKS